MNTMSESKIAKSTPIEAPLPTIKVMGLGGGGSNAVNRMIEYGMKGVEFIAANTDKQVLETNLAEAKIQLGPKSTRGLGAGGNPEIGEAAAEESYREIASALEGADMVFLTAGMGGGTGTGSIPIAARVAKAIGAITVAIVSTPFSFEMGRRQKNANSGILKLQKYADTLITVSNDKLLEVAPKDLPLEMAFKLADDVLRQGIQGITELITETGLVNVDFAHIRRVMHMGGGSHLAIGYGKGQNKAMDALQQALHHPLLDEVCLETAHGIIANFTGGPDLTFSEVAETLNHLQNLTNNQVEIIPGVTNDPNMEERVQVILVITGLTALSLEKAIPGSEEFIKRASVLSQPAFSSAASYPDIKQINDPYNLGVSTTDLDIPAFLRKRVREISLS